MGHRIAMNRNSKNIFFVFSLIIVAPMYADPCDADFAKFCASVVPGDGRRLECLAEHASQVNSECLSDRKPAMEAFGYIPKEQDAIPPTPLYYREQPKNSAQDERSLSAPDCSGWDWYSSSCRH